jgi:hypothetical protein
LQPIFLSRPTSPHFPVTEKAKGRGKEEKREAKEKGSARDRKNPGKEERVREAKNPRY